VRHERAHNRIQPLPNRCRLLLATGFLLVLTGFVPHAGAQPVRGATDTVHVQIKKLTLQEILERCIQGEKSKLAGHHDMTYTLNVRLLNFWEKKKEVRDTVIRVFADESGYSRSVELGEVVHHYVRREGAWVPDEGPELEFKMEVESDFFSDFVELPFFLEEPQEFDFSLLNRTIESDHVIFEISFRPKSDFKPLPAGRIWVDTDAYRIIHEEFTFPQNPFPLILKDIKGFSRHWEELPGGEWVFTRILMEVELRNVFFGQAPQRVSISLQREDFHFDQGYDARVFGER